MKDKFFIDTNIFVYSFDNRYRRKQDIAKKIIKNAIDGKNGVISYQVAREFINLALGKFNHTLSSSELHIYVDRVLEPLCEVFSSMHTYHAAIDISDRFKYSFYDSLILAAALEAGCEIVYSEDLQNGQSIFGMTIKNPFAERNNI